MKNDANIKIDVSRGVVDCTEIEHLSLRGELQSKWKENQVGRGWGEEGKPSTLGASLYDEPPFKKQKTDVYSLAPMNIGNGNISF